MEINETTLIAVCIVAVVAGLAVSSFAPDSMAQRIEACMIQPNTQYLIGRGCVVLSRDHENE
jgi:uncharacterized protein YjeT (DUF2065 family)